MFAKQARRRFGYVILIGITALAAGSAGSRAWAQEAGEPSLDQLFEDAFAALIGVTDPSNRLYSALRLSEADVNHGGRRLEARLVPILEPALKEIPADRQASGMAPFMASSARISSTIWLEAISVPRAAGLAEAPSCRHMPSEEAAG